MKEGRQCAQGHFSRDKLIGMNGIHITWITWRRLTSFPAYLVCFSSANKSTCSHG